METAISVQNVMSTNGYLSTMKVDTDEQKALYYNATSNPDYRLADCINKTILAKDLFIEMIEMEKKDKDGNPTGDMDIVPRVVIIDVQGKSYTAVSYGVYNALKRLCMVYGMPTWDKGIPLTVMQINKGTNRMMTIKVQN